MLDQNTDRMWFVIGAVIVGAAIILIANGTIPDIFASVAESFEETSDKSIYVVDGIYPYNGLPDGLRAYRDAELDFAAYPDVLRISTYGDNGGVYFDTQRYDPNSTYELTFEFRKTQGMLKHMAGHSTHFWGDTTYYLDGVLQGSWHGSHTYKEQFIDDDDIHEVRVLIRTGSEGSEKFATSPVNQHLHIQPNRGRDMSPVVVEIYNLQMEKIE